MNMEHAARPPAVVVGAGLNGLGIVRSLHQINVSCHLIESEMTDPGAHTRFATVHQVQSIADSRLTDALLRLAEQLDTKPVLFLTQEAGVSIVSADRDVLAQQYHLNLPDHDIVQELTTKSGFQNSAAKFGAPIPKTKILHGKPDLKGIQDFTFPVVFKPNSHSAAYAANFRKAYRLNSFDEVTELYEKVYPIEPSIVVQEWVDGQDSDIYFCLQYRKSSEETLMSFCGQKIQSHPPMTGGTASCTMAPQGMWPELVGLTDDYFAKAGVSGMCSMEFKQDPKTKRLVMIEPTIARSDYQEAVATWHGYNIPAAAYQHLVHGVTLEPASLSSQFIWQDTDALRHYQDAPSKIHKTDAIKRSALFSWQDPNPWIFSVKKRVVRKISAIRGS